MSFNLCDNRCSFFLFLLKVLIIYSSKVFIVYSNPLWSLQKFGVIYNIICEKFSVIPSAKIWKQCTYDQFFLTLKKFLSIVQSWKCISYSVCVCVCVCVYVHPPWRLHLSGTAETAKEQINDVVLKMFDSSVGSLHLYSGMQNITFQLAAFSCSYTRSRHSHDLTSIRLAFRALIHHYQVSPSVRTILWADLLLCLHSREGSQCI